MLDQDQLPDKEALYGRFQRGEDWLSRFGRKLAYKSQDMLDDDVNISTQTKSGMGWKELAVIAATGLGGFGLYQNSQQVTSPPAIVQPAAAAAQPTPLSVSDSEYQVRFYDADGNLIAVPHISQRTQ